MHSPFDFFLKNEELFCKECAWIHPHACYSKHSIQLGLNISENEKILCLCEGCGEAQVLFAGEILSLNHRKKTGFSCKIAGRGRLIPDDWVYLPGFAQPGKVHARFRIDDTESFIIRFEDGTEKKLILPLSQLSGDDAFRTYKLLPFQLSDVYIGDWVYHTGRDMVGKAVGILHGVKEQLVLHLENNTFVLLTRSDLAPRTLENAALRSQILFDLQSSYGVDTQNIDITLKSGVVSVRGYCHHLLDKVAISRMIEEMDGVLAVINELEVRPRFFRSDRELERILHNRIVNHFSTGLIGLKLNINQAHIQLEGFAIRDSLKQEIADDLAQIDGLRSLQISLKRPPTPHFKELELIKTVQSHLRKAKIPEDHIQVYCVDKVIYLEGTVSSLIQKKLAGFSAIFAAKSSNVINNLQISSSTAEAQIG